MKNGMMDVNTVRGLIGMVSDSIGEVMDDGMIKNNAINEIIGMAKELMPEVPESEGHEDKKKPLYDDSVKFSFYGCIGECNHHNGILVVSSTVGENENQVFYGTAWCSPKDVYNKSFGKEMAYNDMIDNMNSVALGKKRHHEINARILSDIMANNDAPSWARNMIAGALVRHIEFAFNIWGMENE